MSARVVVPGGLYGDALPTGEYAVGLGPQIRTHRGPIALPPGEDFAMFVRLTIIPTFKVAYKSHLTDATWEWDGVWTRHAVGNGVQPHGYTPDGTLTILPPGVGQDSQGLRYYDPSAPAAIANLDITRTTTGWVTGTPTYNPAMPLATYYHVDRLYEWTHRDGIIVGQGADGGALVQIDGVHHLIEPGDARFIQCHRTGDQVSLAITRFTQHDVILRWLTVADLRALPIYHFPEEPPPMPEPNYLSYVKQARHEAADLPAGAERAWRVTNRAVLLINEVDPKANFGLLSKTAGTNWTGYSIDCLMRRTGETWDVLGDAEGAAVAQWSRTTPTGMTDPAKWRPAVVVGPEPPPVDPPTTDLEARVARLEQFMAHVKAS